MNLLAHNPVLPRPCGDFHPAADAELVLDTRDVGLDGAERDEQLGCDLLVGASPGDAAGDVEFSLRERVPGSGGDRAAGRGELLEEADGNRW